MSKVQAPKFSNAELQVALEAELKSLRKFRRTMFDKIDELEAEFAIQYWVVGTGAEGNPVVWRNEPLCREGKMNTGIANATVYSSRADAQKFASVVRDGAGNPGKVSTELDAYYESVGHVMNTIDFMRARLAQLAAE